MKISKRTTGRQAMIFKKINLLLLITIALFLISGEPIKAQKHSSENTLFWEITGKGLTKPSYLFGTYHFADKGFIDTMKTVNEKLKSADAIVGELLMNEQMAKQLLPYMILKDTSLTQLMTPSEYELVANYLKQETNINLKDVNIFKPVAIQTLIVQASAPKTFTATNPAIDQYFQDYGRVNGKTIIGLETVEDQAKALFGSSLKRQVELLLKSVKEGNKDKALTLKIYNLYIAQNLKELEKFFLNDTSLNAEEMDRLLKNRNEKWIANLPELMKGQSLFIAVGAGHLVGENGLIKGLQTKGYIVKPLATN